MLYDAPERLRLAARDCVYGARSALRQRRSYNDTPLVLCNSFPKSGTHLLAQILLQFEQVRAWNDIISVQSLSGVMNTERHIRWKLCSAPPGSLVRSHLMYSPAVQDALALRPMRKLFVYRDLRDVAVSHANWVLKEPRIFLHSIYKALPDFHACLMASIVGTPPGTPFGSNASQPDIATDFRRWQGWLSDPDALALRFEDLVGERGGGEETVRLNRIESIASLLGAPLDRATLQSRFGSVAMDPKASHTFRKGNKGAIGGWQEKFSPAHKDAFKRVAGDLLIELGYEDGDGW